MQTPISLSVSVFAATCSSVLTLTLYFGLVERAVHGAGADLDEIGAAGQHRLIAHPQDARLELVGDLERITGRADDIAAADIDLVLEREGHRLAGDRALSRSPS